MKKIFILLLLVSVVGGCYYKFIYEQEDVDPRLVAYGNIDIRDVALGFRVSGRIAEMLYDEGDLVKKGDVVARLDAVPYQEELAVNVAQKNELEVRLINAKKQFERKKTLVRTGAVSRSAYDDALNAQNEIEAAIITAKSRINQAQTKLKDTEIHAPAEGTILTRVREPGSIVSQGATIYSVSLIKPMWARCYVAEENLAKIYPGKKAQVFTDSGGRYEGRVGYISPQAEFTPKTVETTQLRTELVYQFRVIIDEFDQGVRQGMPVTVRFED